MQTGFIKARHNIFSGACMDHFESYKMLSQDLQAEILLECGVYLELIRNAPRLSIELYGLFGFYVEVYFDKGTEEPLFLRPFSSVKELDPYLHQVEIDGIFETK
jgi:hypothetical protein